MANGDLGRLVARLEADASRFNRELRVASRELRGFETRTQRSSRAVRRGLDRMFQGAGRIARSMFSLRGAAVAAAGVGGMGLLFTRSVRTAEQLQRQADQTGINVESLQELQIAAERMGSSTERITQGLGTFNRRMGQAAAGQGELRSQLLEMNPELLQQLQSTDSLAEQFLILADGIASMESQQARAAVAAAAFDKEVGLGLLPALQQGRGAFELIAREANNLGQILRESTTREAVETQDAIDKLSRTFRSQFTRAILGAQKPTQSLLDTLNDPETLDAIKDLAEDTAALARGIVSTGRAAANAKNEIAEWVAPLLRLANVSEDIEFFFRGQDALIPPDPRREADERRNPITEEQRLRALGFDPRLFDPRPATGGGVPTPSGGGTGGGEGAGGTGGTGGAAPSIPTGPFDAHVREFRRVMEERERIERRVTRTQLEEAGKRIELRRMEFDELRAQVRQAFPEGEERARLLEGVSEAERDALAKLREEGEQTFGALSRGADLFADTFGRVIGDAVSGAEVNFERLAASFFASLARMEARALASSIFGGGDGQQGGGGRSLLLTGGQALFGAIGFQHGGVTTRPTLAALSEHGGTEIAMPLERAPKLIAETLRQAGGGNGGRERLDVRVVNETGDPGVQGRVREVRGRDGMTEMVMVIEKQMAKRMRQGGDLHRATASVDPRFGSRPGPRR